jgi:hypothetical protein
MKETGDVSVITTNLAHDFLVKPETRERIPSNMARFFGPQDLFKYFVRFRGQH